MKKYAILLALMCGGCIPERAIMVDCMGQHIDGTKKELDGMLVDMVKAFQSYPEDPVPEYAVNIMNERLSKVEDHIQEMNDWTNAALIDMGEPPAGPVPIFTRQEDIKQATYKQNAKKMKVLKGMGKMLAKRIGIPIPPSKDTPIRIPYGEGAAGIVALISGLIIKKINDKKSVAENEKEKYRDGAKTFAKALDSLKKTSVKDSEKVISAATNSGKTPQEIAAGKQVYEEFKAAGEIS